MSASLRVLELYCGIGGVAAALEPACRAGTAKIALAVDINRDALEVYGRHFAHARKAALIESLPARRLAALEADLWWASPPCQPFTRRGLGRDLHDPRAATFRALVERVEAVRPRYLALENVAPFEASEARQVLLQALASAGYGRVVEQVICPSGLGVPNRRPRYYLLASRDGDVVERELPESRPGSLESYLLEPPDRAKEWLLDAEQARRYRHALHVVEAGDTDAVTSCFTAAYGRSPVRSGSYLATEEGPRRFSPAEVLRLLGFPTAFELACGQGEKGRKKAWRLAGNSLSVPAVRHVLSQIPELAGVLGHRI